MFLLLILIYVTNITAIPNKIVLFEGEKHNLETVFGVYQNKEKAITTSLYNGANNVVNEETIHLSLFNLINIKDVNVTTIENTKVIPLRKYCRFKIIFKWGISNRNDRN